MHIVIVYDVESERTRSINAFLDEFIDWKQNSVFAGEVTDTEHQSIQSWIDSFVESDEEVLVYETDGGGTEISGDDSSTNDEIVTDTSSDAVNPVRFKQ